MRRRGPRILVALALFAALAAFTAAFAPAAQGSPLPGASYDSGDGNQDDGFGLDWQSAYGSSDVQQSPDANDDCFVGGVKELTPNQWAFNTSAGGCTPGKSNLRVAFVNPESTPTTTFGHFAFWRNDTTGNTFLTFELNQAATTWTNATGTTIPCRSTGDVLVSFEVGGSALSTALYKWTGDGSGPTSCPNGANGTFTGSGAIPASRFQGTMNSTGPITNYVNPGTYGGSFPGNSFGEAAIDLPAVLQAMGQGPCFGFLQMQVHSRSSSSITSAMIDYTRPVPVYIQSCAATGTAYQDTNGDGIHGSGEPGVAGAEFYVDLDDDGVLDAGEPTGLSDSTGFYRILNVPGGTYTIRQVPREGWGCSAPDPCHYERQFLTSGNSTGNDFGSLAPSSASGTKFDDLNGNGSIDAGEPGLAGVRLYADYDDDGSRDLGEPSGISGANGHWTVTGIAPGVHKIREVAQSGWSCSTPVPCHSERTFSSGTSVTGLVFGNYGAASLSGSVFEDMDGDGASRENSDADLSGWQVYLDANGNDSFDLGEAQTSTGVSGGYSFTGLAPGTHTVRVTSPSATWYCTRPSLAAPACEREVTLTSAGSSPGLEFGFSRTATVSGSKFDDTNNSGVADTGEGPLQGFTFWVDYDNDNSRDAEEPAGTSTAGGDWTITGVRAGSWTLREVPNGAYACTRPSPCTYALMLASNATSAGHQFGNYVSRSVSGVVFADGNADGLAREAGEAGVPGWVVYSDANNNSSQDPGEPSSTTNSLGQYNITGLANGNYRIRLVPRLGWTCSYPAGCLNTGSIGSGQSDTGKNFGVWGPASIAGSVFEDADADGAAREAGEAALQGRRVYLDSNGNSAYDTGEPSAVTDASGNYTIAGLNPGTYTVRQVLPSGWTCSRPSPCSRTVTVSGADVTGQSFGSYTSGSIAGKAYEDAAADGSRNGADGSLAGRTIFLDANGNGQNDPSEIWTITDASGDYSFSALVPGAYEVRQELPGGWTQSQPGGAHSVTITSGAVLGARDFGSYTTGAISGTAFEDADFDTSGFEAGDSPIASRTIYLDDNGNGSQDAGEQATTTDVMGAYSFAGLAPGSYSVRMATPAGWACVYPAGCSYDAAVTSASAAPGRDFGSYVGASVSGTVFEDADADGAAREAGETGVAGRRVFLDANANGIRDPGEPSVLTDSAGNYELTGIAAQEWQLRLELPPAWSCDSPAPCRYELTLASGAALTGRQFGVHTTGSISGHLFTDRDNDGQPQVFGENDQPGRTVYIDTDNDGTLDAGETSTVTDELGDYLFPGLEPGSYRIRQVLPGGWSCSTPSPCVWSVGLESAGVVDGRDFSSWTTASFSGEYFEDLDADGDYPQPGEPALPGRTVYLDLNDNGSADGGEPTTVTAGDGRYGFTGLAPGSYVVRPEVQPAGWTCSYPAGCATVLTLEAGEAAQDVSFGAWTQGTVVGTVFADGDGSGSQGGSEAGLSGWSVYADLDDDGVLDAGEPFDTTGAGGGYVLALDPGIYTLREVRPTGWTCSAPDPCGHTVEVHSGAALTAKDFANQTTGLGGTVFDDADGDLAQDAGEVGRPAVEVYVDSDDSGTHDAGEPLQVTGADGSYSFVGLPAGDHAIRIVLPSAWLCLTPGCVQLVSLGAGEAVSGQDFALALPASIGGVKFEDADADGSPRDPADSGVAGSEVYIDTNNNADHDEGEPSVTTDPDGSYAFTGLAPGEYVIRQVGDPGWSCSYPSPCSWTATLASGDSVTDRDFGNWRKGSVEGHVFVDRAADGGRQAGDAGRVGIDVWIDYDEDGQIDVDEPQTTTDAMGYYQLQGIVNPGSWLLRAAPGGGWNCSSPAACEQGISFSSGETVLEQDFATWEPGTIAGQLYDDGNGDGSARQAGDAPLEESVWLDLDRDGVIDAGETLVSSPSSGSFLFTGVAPGTYTLRAAPGGRVCTAPAGCERTVVVLSGDAHVGQDFGSYSPPANVAPPPLPTTRRHMISGVVFEDRDADGLARGPGEPALSAWTVYLDLNENGRADPAEPVTITDGDGRYGFSGLLAGSYLVRLSMPSNGWHCSHPAGCSRRVTLSGEDLPGQDFGAWRSSLITGYAFEDSDRDGSAREPGDGPLAGWIVYLDLNGNGRRDPGEPYDVTDERGRYGISNVRPGSFTVRMSPPTGSRYRCTYPAGGCAAEVTLRAGDDRQSADFGSITGIRRASRRAGLRSPAACRTRGFRVYLRAGLARRVVLSIDGRRFASRTTSRTGRYTFTANARRFALGVHRISAQVTFLDGTRRTVRGTFYRCRGAAPRYTG